MCEHSRAPISRRCCRRRGRKGRIGKVSADPLLPLRAFIDIGGSGATADAFTIWIVQWVGHRNPRLGLLSKASARCWRFTSTGCARAAMQQAILYLPHDGINENNVTGKRYEDHLREAGFTVEPPVKNQGRGAAMMRIEALRRLGRRSGGTRRRPKPEGTRSGSTTSARTTRNIGLGRSTTGPLMPPMRWG